MFSGLDWFPTLLAAAGDPDVKDRLLKGGTELGGNDLQGASRRLQPACLSDRAAAESARNEFLLLQRRRRAGRHALRRLEGRVLRAARRRAASRSGRTRSPACEFRSSSICAWTLTNAPTSFPTSTTTGWPRTPICLNTVPRAGAPFLQTFVEYPPSQRPASFSVDQMVESLMKTLEKTATK